jgi:hypothetical protein
MPNHPGTMIAIGSIFNNIGSYKTLQERMESGNISVLQRASYQQFILSAEHFIASPTFDTLKPYCDTMRAVASFDAATALEIASLVELNAETSISSPLVFLEMKAIQQNTVNALLKNPNELTQDDINFLYNYCFRHAHRGALLHPQANEPSVTAIEDMASEGFFPDAENSPELLERSRGLANKDNPIGKRILAALTKQALPMLDSVAHFRHN